MSTAERAHIRTVNLQPTPTISQMKGMLSYMSKLFNISIHDIVQTIHGDSSATPFNTGNIIMDAYGFPSEAVAKIKFKTAQDVAKDVIQTVINTLGLDPNQFGQKTEVQIDETSISRALRYLNLKEDPSGMSGFKEGVSPKLRFEQLRELFLSDIALRLLKQGLIEEPGGKLSEIQEVLNKKLYEGPAGYDELRSHRIRVDKTGKVASRGKEVVFENRMRPIFLKGNKRWVQTDFDKKSYHSQILKLLSDFVPYSQNGQVIYPEFDPVGMTENGRLHIHDRSRFRFVIDGGAAEIYDLAELIIGMKDSKDNPLFEMAILSEQKYNRNQSKTWEIRYKAWKNGIPVEILFYDIAGYYNSTHQFGEFNNNLELYDGADHRLYEIRRLLKILEFLFPYDIYKRNEVRSHEQYTRQLLKYATKMSRRVAEELKLTED